MAFPASCPVPIKVCIGDVSASALLPTVYLTIPWLTEFGVVSRVSTVRTNAAVNGLGCAPLNTCAGISVGWTWSTCYFFMLIQHITTPAFCIQGLFVGGSELSFAWPGSPRASQPHLWEDSRHNPGHNRVRPSVWPNQVKPWSRG